MVRLRLGKGTGPQVVHPCCSGRQEAANTFMNYQLEYNFNIIAN